MLFKDGGDHSLSLARSSELFVDALKAWMTDRWDASDEQLISTPDEHIFMCACNLAQCAKTGGFKRWFENSQRELLPDVLHALEVLGAHDEALLLQEAVSAVSKEEREGLEFAYDFHLDTSQILIPATEATLAELDRAFGALSQENSLYVRLAAFARQRCLGPKPRSKPKLKPTRKRGPRGESKG